MSSIRSQLKVVVLLLVLVLGVTVFERAETIALFLDSEQNTASILNPVASFLGLSTESSNPSKTSTETNATEDYFNSTADDPFTTTKNSNAASLRTVTVPNTKTSSYTSGAALSQNAPTLLCVPGVVSESEEAIIMWACRDEAHTTVGENITTQGALIGLQRVQPSEDTIYTVECVNDIDDVDNTAASCTIEVAKPALAIIATPSSPTRGGAVTLTWNTKDVQSCIVTSNVHSSFKRNGISGEALSPSITQDTTFILTCETRTGVLEERTVEVDL